MKKYIITVDEQKKDIMGNMPLVEKAKELITCENCIHGHDDGNYGTICEFDAEHHHDDWYCADGVKRDEKE